MSKLKSLTFDKYKVNAKQTLNEAIDSEPDSVVVFCFWNGGGEFRIKSSKAEDRVRMVGLLTEAVHHLIKSGDLT